MTNTISAARARMLEADAALYQDIARELGYQARRWRRLEWPLWAIIAQNNSAVCSAKAQQLLT